MNEREKLEGWTPELSAPDDLRAALDKAFEYRGDVCITLRSGERIEGYVFDRQSAGPELKDCIIRLFPKTGAAKISICYADITSIHFSGRDMADGRNFALWLEKYREKKGRGERYIALEPEPLD
jgi:hypothetical protein